MRNVLGSLALANDIGGIHRDFKPDNLLLRGRDPAARVFLGDWGCSVWEKEDQRDFVGTSGYAAPEVTKEQPYDGRADVFSLGATAYELVTGRPLFCGDSEEDVIRTSRLGVTSDEDWSHPAWGTECGRIRKYSLQNAEKLQSAGR